MAVTYKKFIDWVNESWPTQTSLEDEDKLQLLSGGNVGLISTQNSIKTSPYKYINKKAQTAHYSGNITSGTTTTITDSTANWTVDEWVGKAIKIILSNGNTITGPDYEFAIIASNTNNTLIVDDNLLFVPCDSCTYKIVDTLNISNGDLNSVVALNIVDADVAVVLPKVTSENERLYLNCYVEVGDSGDNIVAIIGRETDYQLGAKFGTLEWRGEGVVLYSHTWDATLDIEGDEARPHWDVINAYNIQRLATGYWNVDESLANAATPTEVGTGLIPDNERRFIAVSRDGITYFRYQDLISRQHIATCNALFEKVGGGGGEVTIQFGIRDFTTGEISLIPGRTASTRFGGGEGFAEITLRVPIFFERNQELVLLYTKDTGVINFVAGSTIDILEI